MLARESQRLDGVGLFFDKNFALSASFFAERQGKSFAGLRHNWGIAVFFFRKTLYPKPLYFSKKQFHYLL